MSTILLNRYQVEVIAPLQMSQLTITFQYQSLNATDPLLDDHIKVYRRSRIFQHTPSDSHGQLVIPVQCHTI